MLQNQKSKPTQIYTAANIHRTIIYSILLRSDYVIFNLIVTCNNLKVIRELCPLNQKKFNNLTRFNIWILVFTYVNKATLYYVNSDVVRN